MPSGSCCTGYGLRRFLRNRPSESCSLRWTNGYQRNSLAASPPRAPSADLGTIGPSITIRGEVTGNEDLVIRGRIEGTVTLPKNDVVLGEDGHVKANISAKKITVEGSVQGDLQGKELVTVKRTGSVHGNISAARVVLEDGCKFTGSIDMGAAAAAQPPAGAGAAKLR